MGIFHLAVDTRRMFFASAWAPDARFLPYRYQHVGIEDPTPESPDAKVTRRQSHPTPKSPDAKVTRRQIVGGPDASHLPIFHGILLRVGGQNWRFFLALGVTRVR